MVALGKSALQRHGTFDRIDNARKLREQPITHKFENTAVVARDHGFEQFLSTRQQALIGARFVTLHKSRETNHIGSKDG
jgi:hypothetical protein